MNYFEFFGMEESFYIDESALKKIYIQKSREFHPDFYSEADEESKLNALELSVINNTAYSVLRYFDTRLEYILKVNNLLEEGKDNQISQDFLIEMMDINEALMEIEMGEGNIRDINDNILKIKADIFNQVKPLLQKYKPTSVTAREDLLKIKEYYLKNKYLLRIKEKIDTFAD